MSGSQRGALFDSSRSGAGAAIPRGRYVARIRTDAASAASSGVVVSDRLRSAASSGARLPVAEASVARGGAVDVTDGKGRVKLAGEVGHRSVPVAMDMKSWRRAHAAGLTVPYAGASGDGRRARTSAGAVVLTIDLTDMHRVGAELGRSAEAMLKGHVVISRTINHGLRRLQTKLKRRAAEWTGMSRIGEAAKGFKAMPSTPATMRGVLTVRDNHRAITKDLFGASWSRSNPGATHRAWGRPQLAIGAFMIPGKAPIFKREGKGRKPIAALWGPNVAREIERHRPEVQADVDAIGVEVAREAARLMRVALTGRGK